MRGLSLGCGGAFRAAQQFKDNSKIFPRGRFNFWNERIIAALKN